MELVQAEARLLDYIDTIIGDDRCCAYNQAFEEDVQLGAGIDWVHCVCTRWLHEECVIDCIVDEMERKGFALIVFDQLNFLVIIINCDT